MLINSTTNKYYSSKNLWICAHTHDLPTNHAMLFSSMYNVYLKHFDNNKIIWCKLFVHVLSFCTIIWKAVINEPCLCGFNPENIYPEYTLVRKLSLRGKDNMVGSWSLKNAPLWHLEWDILRSETQKQSLHGNC